MGKLKTEFGWTLVVYLERELALCANSDGDPEIFWVSEESGDYIHGGRGLREEINFMTKDELRGWMKKIEKWQADSDGMRRTGDKLYRAASSACCIIKGGLE